MFEILFTYPAVLARHQTGPAAAERGSYLAHCAGQGLARETCCVLPANCLWLLSGLM